MAGLIYPRGYRKPAQPELIRDHPINRGLAGCWLLGDASSASPGLVKDIGPYSFDASIFTGTGSLDTVSGHHGGLATEFTPNGYIKTGNLPDDPFLGAVSVTAWVWFDNYTGDKIIFFKGVGNGITDTPIEFLTANASGYPQTLRSNAGGFHYAYNGSGNFVPTGGWHHVGVTFADGTVTTEPTFYSDGVARATTNSGGGSGPVTGTGQPMGIGYRPDGGADFDGKIEGVRVFSRELSHAEILQLYAEPYIGIKERGSRLYYPVGAAASTFQAAWAGGANTILGPGAI